MKLPYVVGYHMFAWVDQPAAGCGWRENSNYGRVDDEPYSALTKMFTKLNAELPALHGSGAP